MENEEKDLVIDLGQLLLSFLKRIWCIVLAAVVFGAGGFLYTKFAVTPVYSAGAMMIVNSEEDNSKYVSYENIRTSRELANTYSVIILSRSVLQTVIDDLDLDISYAQLKSNTTVSAVDETQVLSISVNDTDRDTAIAIVDKILEVSPEIIVGSIGGGSVKTVEKTYSSTYPVSPSVPKNTILATLIGVVLACGVLTVMFFLDNTYKSEIDISKDLGYPVLSVIPTIESCIRLYDKQHKRMSQKEAGYDLQK